jgi:hypothetical protein
MNKAKLTTVFAAGVVLAIASTASANVFDDFDDNSLDGSKWGTHTTDQVGAAPNMAVTEENMALTLTEGGTIFTRQNFNSDDGLVTASGEFTINTLNDRLFFYFDAGGFGSQANFRHGGLVYFIFGNNAGGFIGDDLRMQNDTGGSAGPRPPTEVFNSIANVVADSTVLEFTATADPTATTFSLGVASGDTSGASGSALWTGTITGPLSFNHAMRRVAFSNNSSGNKTLVLDNFSVTPEPGSIALIGLGALMLGAARRMKRS